MRFEFEHCWHFPATPEQRAVLQAIHQNRQIEASRQTVIAELVAERFIEPEDNGFRLTANGRYLVEKHSELDRKLEFAKLKMAIDDYKRSAGAPIENEAPAGFVESDYVEPILKSDLAILFGVDRATIARWIGSGELRTMPGTSARAKKVRVHGDDFPDGLKRPHERKQKLSGLPKHGKRQ